MTLWIAYFIGQLVHTWARAQLIVQCPKTPFTTLRSYLVDRWPAMVARIFLASVGFWIWWENPEIMRKALAAIAAYLIPGALRTFLESISFPLNPGTAALYGYFSDSVLDKLGGFAPFLKQYIPGLNGAKQNGNTTG